MSATETPSSSINSKVVSPAKKRLLLFAIVLPILTTLFLFFYEIYSRGKTPATRNTPAAVAPAE